MKKIRVVLMCLLCVMLVACGKKEQTVDDVSEIENTDKMIEAVVEETAPDIENNDSAEAVIEENNSAEENVSDTVNLYNNGGHFVEYNGKIYYLCPEEAAMNKSGLFGEYMDIACGMQQLKSYDLQSGNSEDILMTVCYGKLYISGEKLFVNLLYEGAEENANRVGIMNLVSGAYDELDNQVIEGGDTKGHYVATWQWESGRVLINVFKDGEFYTEIVDKGLSSLIGVEDGFLVASVYDNTTQQMKLMCYDLNDNNKAYELGMVPERELESFGSYPEFEQWSIEDNKLYLSICWYEGTGHFFAEQAFVTADLCTENSLEKVEVKMPDYEGGDPNSSAFAVKDGNLEIVKGVPNTGYIDYASEEGEYGYITSEGERVYIGKGLDYVIGDDGIRWMVENIEYVNGKIIYQTNDLDRDPENDIGWREAYIRKSVNITIVNVDDKEVKCLEDVENDNYSY